MQQNVTEIKTYTPEEIAEILDKHKKWLADEEGGERANLYGANLEDANLYGANLEDANLSGAKYGDETLRGFFQVGPVGSRKSMLQVFGVGASSFVFRAGCFTGNAEEFAAKVQSKHGDNEHAAKYLQAIEFAKIMLPEVEVQTEEVQA